MCFSPRTYSLHWYWLTLTQRHSCAAHGEAVKVNNAARHNIFPQAVLYIVLMEEPPSCRTGISSPAIDWMRRDHCALTPLWPRAIHIQSGLRWYARLATSLIHIECCGSVAGQSWAISKATGDLQMTGQSVWWEFAQRKRRGWLEVDGKIQQRLD